MSKIIKGHEYPELAAFDFHQIDKEASFPHQNDAAPGTGQAKEAPPDPLVELENTIQKRLHEAERKASEIEREAYEKGYAQGEKDGLEYGRKSMQIAKERMEHILGGLETLPEKVLKDYRDWFLTTCVAFVKKLLRRELSTAPETVLELVDSLLAEAETTHSVTIHLNPSDLDIMKKHTDFQSSIGSSERSLVFKSDPQMERGGCRLESDIQLLDASMEARFALLEGALLQHESNT